MFKFRFSIYLSLIFVLPVHAYSMELLSDEEVRSYAGSLADLVLQGAQLSCHYYSEDISLENAKPFFSQPDWEIQSIEPKYQTGKKLIINTPNMGPVTVSWNDSGIVTVSDTKRTISAHVNATSDGCGVSNMSELRDHKFYEFSASDGYEIHATSDAPESEVSTYHLSPKEVEEKAKMLKPTPLPPPLPDPRKLQEHSAASLVRLKDWKATHSHNYIAHASMPENADDVLQKRSLRPAQGVLIRDHLVSYEAYKRKGARSTRRMPNYSKIMEMLPNAKLDLPPLCDGIFFLKLVQRGDDLILMRRGQNDSSWTELRKLNPHRAQLNDDQGMIQKYESRLKHFSNESDRKLLRLLTDEKGNLLSLEYPMLNCSADLSEMDFQNDPHLHIRDVLPYSGYYMDESVFKAAQRKITGFARLNQFAVYEVMLALAEFKRSSLDKDLASLSLEYFQALVQFTQAKERSKVASWLSPSSYWSSPSPPETHLGISAILAKYRNYYLHLHNNLQEDISFSVNTVNWDYGRVAIIVGQGLETFADIDRWDGIVTRSFQPTFKGELIEVDLATSNVLILGPKADLAPYVLDPLIAKNILFIEDLSREERNLFHILR